MFIDYFVPLGILLYFLIMIFGLPTSVFLLPWIDTFNINEYSIPIRAVNGLVIIALLWIGIRGLKKSSITISKPEN
jgi:hypothetical protein